MNNLPSYCGLVDSKIRASDKDLPVQFSFFVIVKEKLADVGFFHIKSSTVQLYNSAVA